MAKSSSSSSSEGPPEHTLAMRALTQAFMTPEQEAWVQQIGPAGPPLRKDSVLVNKNRALSALVRAAQDVLKQPDGLRRLEESADVFALGLTFLQVGSDTTTLQTMCTHNMPLHSCRPISLLQGTPVVGLAYSSSPVVHIYNQV